MKRLLLMIIALILVFPVYSQKVKYKKGVIYVNKQKKFKYVRTKKGGISSTTNYYLADLNGEHILDILDTTLYLEPLPYEEGKIPQFSTIYVRAPKLNKTTIIPAEYSFNIRRAFMKKLKKIGFFKTLDFNEDMYNKFINLSDLGEIHKKFVALDSVNAKRRRNYNKSVETFGEFPKRKPGNIKMLDKDVYENGVKICTFELDKKGGYASVFNIINTHGKIIATYAFIPSEKRANVTTKIDNKIKWFSYAKWTNDPTEFLRFKYASQYLFKMGYL